MQVDECLPLPEIERHFIDLRIGFRIGNEVPQAEVQKLEELGKLRSLAGRQAIGKLRGLEGVNRG